MKKIIYTLKAIALLAIVFGCSSEEPETTQNEDLQELSTLKTEIEEITLKGICSISENNCDFIALGSKPCGGAQSYIVFSTSISIDLLKEKVSIYNEKENEFNHKWGVTSDCTVVLPPIRVECIDGICTAIY